MTRSHRELITRYRKSIYIRSSSIAVALGASALIPAVALWYHGYRYEACGWFLVISGISFFQQQKDPFLHFPSEHECALALDEKLFLKERITTLHDKGMQPDERLAFIEQTLQSVINEANLPKPAPLKRSFRYFLAFLCVAQIASFGSFVSWGPQEEPRYISDAVKQEVAKELHELLQKQDIPQDVQQSLEAVQDALSKDSVKEQDISSLVEDAKNAISKAEQDIDERAEQKQHEGVNAQNTPTPTATPTQEPRKDNDKEQSQKESSDENKKNDSKDSKDDSKDQQKGNNKGEQQQKQSGGQDSKEEQNKDDKQQGKNGSSESKESKSGDQKNQQKEDLSKAKNSLDKLSDKNQKQNQKEDSKSDGDEKKDQGNKDQGKKDQGQQGKQDSKDQKDQNKPGDKKPSDSQENKKEQPGASGQKGKEGTTPKEPSGEGDKKDGSDKKGEGQKKDGDKTPSDAQKKSDSQKKDSTGKSGNESGDAISKAQDEAPPSKQGEGQSNAPLKPSVVEEKMLGSMDEKLDPRYTGKDSSIKKNKNDAQPKTAIDGKDAVLGTIEEQGSQPIPLEYRDQLENN